MAVIILQHGRCTCSREQSTSTGDNSRFSRPDIMFVPKQRHERKGMLPCSKNGAYFIVLYSLFRNAARQRHRNVSNYRVIYELIYSRSVVSLSTTTALLLVKINTFVIHDKNSRPTLKRLQIVTINGSASNQPRVDILSDVTDVPGKLLPRPPRA